MLKSIQFSVLFCSLFLFVFAIHIAFPQINIAEYSVFPRKWDHIYGIITMHFIHEEYRHLFSNLIPLFVLLSLLHFFYQELYLKVLFNMMWISGLWVWIAARVNYHLGASALVYGLASFIFFSGIFRKYPLLIRISLLVVFLYGSMVWGIFPIEPAISWEGHLFGALSGLILAYYYRHDGPQRRKFVWEDEPETEDVSMEDRYWERGSD